MAMPERISVRKTCACIDINFREAEICIRMYVNNSISITIIFVRYTCACGILGYMNNTISLSSRVTV